MYSHLLQAIAERMNKYGDRLQTPCTEAELKDLRQRVKSKLRCNLPDGYEAFLLKANGLDWNGLVVYASSRLPIYGYSDRFIEGLVEANLDWRDVDDLKSHLVLADDGTALYTLNLKANAYDVVTQVGLTRLMRFESFDKLLAEALNSHL